MRKAVILAFGISACLANAQTVEQQQTDVVLPQQQAPVPVPIASDVIAKPLGDLTVQGQVHQNKFKNQQDPNPRRLRKDHSKSPNDKNKSHKKNHSKSNSPRRKSQKSRNHSQEGKPNLANQGQGHHQQWQQNQPVVQGGQQTLPSHTRTQHHENRSQQRSHHSQKKHHDNGRQQWDHQRQGRQQRQPNQNQPIPIQPASEQQVPVQQAPIQQAQIERKPDWNQRGEHKGRPEWAGKRDHVGRPEWAGQESGRRENYQNHHQTQVPRAPQGSTAWQPRQIAPNTAGNVVQNGPQ